MKKIKVIVEKTRDGYSAYTEKYGVATTGDNLDELKANIIEAINLYLEDEGKEISINDLKITLDIPQFFEFYNVINAKALSERIHMNQSLLAQYINGVKSPSEKQTQRILDGVRQLGRELSEIEIKF